MKVIADSNMATTGKRYFLRTLSRFTVSIFMVITVLAGTAKFSEAQRPPSPIPEAGYIIYNADDGNTYAKDDITMEEVYSGTASSVIQSAINAIGTEGGKIYIKAGTYTLSSTIALNKSNLVIEGEGEATKLILGNNCNVDVMSAGGINYKGLILRDFEINGNKANNSSGRGLVFTGYFSRIDNLIVRDCAGNGFVAIPPSSGSMVDNCVQNILTKYNEGDGFVWGTEDGGDADNYFINIISSYNDGNGIVWDAASLYGWNINTYGNDLNGMIIKGAYTKITQGEFSGNGRHGLVFDEYGAWGTMVIGSRAYSNSTGSAGTYDGFYFDAAEASISGMASLINCYAGCTNNPKTQNLGVNKSTTGWTSATRFQIIGGAYAGNIDPVGIELSSRIQTDLVLLPKFENSAAKGFEGDGSTKVFTIASHGLAENPTDRTKISAYAVPQSEKADDACPVAAYPADIDEDGEYEALNIRFTTAPSSGYFIVKWHAELN